MTISQPYVAGEHIILKAYYELKSICLENIVIVAKRLRVLCKPVKRSVTRIALKVSTQIFFLSADVLV